MPPVAREDEGLLPDSNPAPPAAAHPLPPVLIVASSCSPEQTLVSHSPIKL